MMLVSRVHESSVIHAPVSSVWEKVRSMNFEWWTLVGKAECADGVPDRVGSIHTVLYKDGSTWAIRCVRALWCGTSVLLNSLKL